MEVEEVSFSEDSEEAVEMAVEAAVAVEMEVEAAVAVEMEVAEVSDSSRIKLCFMSPHRILCSCFHTSVYAAPVQTALFLDIYNCARFTSFQNCAQNAPALFEFTIQIMRLVYSLEQRVSDVSGLDGSVVIVPTYHKVRPTNPICDAAIDLLQDIRCFSLSDV